MHVILIRNGTLSADRIFRPGPDHSFEIGARYWLRFFSLPLFPSLSLFVC